MTRSTQGPKGIFGAVLAGSVSLIAMAAPAWGQSLEDTLIMAYNSNPTLQAERANLRAIDEGRVQAMAGRLPTVSADASISRQHVESQSTFVIGDDRVSSNSTSDATPKNYSLTASQLIYGGGQVSGAIDQATAQIMAGRESLRSVEQTVLVDAVTAFMDVRRDARVVEIRRNNAEVLAQHLQAARDRFEVGEITRTDVAQAEARLSGAQAELSAAQSQLAVSRAAYERVTGQPPATLEEPPALPGMPDSLADAAEFAYQSSPQLLAARFSEESARHAIRIARSNLRPEVTLSASASAARDSSFSGDERDSTSVTGRVSIPIFTGGLNRSRVRAAVAQEEQARHQVRQARRQVTEGVTNAWSNYVTSLAVIESSQQAVRANEIALDGVEQEAYVGIRTTLDVLDAEQELLNSRLTLVTAERDSYVAGYQLLQAMGLVSAEQLGLAVDVYDPAEQDMRQSRFPNLDLTPWD
ncbi:TolC family outer membrane protein [Maricaulis virginensis]|uniref:Membrane protein n=1 Tax=Maricaulis virginensis TaxID=144022 RepID=A0A9W6II65_9PROT|nr:TolC family outer membrane protein [Maricaulis virginensis]GLK50776.1 membrane protein [Maricaulis virginensis]